ncbi:carboxymuconolactone decarboxylase family protein [Nonomuraea candida]|uniref:carboxymuconolactone decarboxylase family protein n=1 Tax=Nonomuraea candida TaxID=359159 RepID=UPI0005B7F1C7|nr:carboxymuconolactone decarboxylase family protein [Nonomuraea candida]
MGTLLSRMAAPRALAQVRHVTPVPPGAATGLVSEVYAQMERDFGMPAPPVALHSPAPGTMAACWLLLRESLLASGTVGRVLKEAVATGVSAANACPYCVDVHRATLRGLTRQVDPGLRRVASWARACGVRETATRHEPPLLTGHSRELVAVAVTFHYLNRMVHVFLGDSPLPPEVPAGARGTALRLFGLALRPAARRSCPRGISLPLLPAAPLPADLSWTRHVPGKGVARSAGTAAEGGDPPVEAVAEGGDPLVEAAAADGDRPVAAVAAGGDHLVEAFARAAGAIGEGGARRLPGPVRELVTARVAAWEGEPPGLGRGWADAAVAGLPPGQRPAARLALLTALASYQVDDTVVAEFRNAEPDHAALVEVTSWAALTAARRVGSWQPLTQPTRT